MIKQNIKDWAERLGYDTAYKFWKASGLNEQTAYRLWDDSDHIPRKSVMVKLYQKFALQPNQYLYAIPDFD